MSVRRTAIAATFACVAGVAVAHVATDGFQAYTLESARRLHALRSTLPVPDLALDLADGGRACFGQMPARILLVDFVYTNCPTICTVLGSVNAQLRQRLAPEIDAGEVRLVTVTFDPARDSVDALRAYRARHTADATGWALGRPVHSEELRALLEAFGVVVMPDGEGGFVHNAAVHVLGTDRRLVAILGVDDVEGIVNTVRTMAAQDAHRVAVR